MAKLKAKPGYQGLTRIIKVAGYFAKGFRVLHGHTFLRFAGKLF